MAKKIASRSTPKPDAAAAELDVLHPERELKLRDRLVVVREYGGVEWLRLLPKAAPMVDAIAAMLEVGRTPTYDEALAVLAENIDSLLPLVAQAADMPLADVAALDPDDLELLLMTWWGVCGRFFLARASNRVAVAMAERRLARSATASSTPPSSPTATSSPSSGDTPGAS